MLGSNLLRRNWETIASPPSPSPATSPASEEFSENQVCSCSSTHQLPAAARQPCWKSELREAPLASARSQNFAATPPARKQTLSRFLPRSLLPCFFFYFLLLFKALQGLLQKLPHSMSFQPSCFTPGDGVFVVRRFHSAGLLALVSSRSLQHNFGFLYFRSEQSGRVLNNC